MLSRHVPPNMGGEGEIYEELLFLSVFLGSLWLAGYVFRLIKISPIVGQILVGILLGPNGIDFVPLFTGEEEIELLQEELGDSVLEQECEQRIQDAIDLLNNSTTPPRLLEEENEFEIENFLQILGQLGVTLLILESGLHVDFKTLKLVGPSAFLVALIGTFMPIILGIGTATLLGFETYPEGLAMGAVLAPTSVGIALKLLHEAHVLDSVFGQTIVTAAFTDDIFSLVTLAVLLELAAGELNAGSVLIPLCSSFGFIGGAFLIAIYVVPMTFPALLNKISTKCGQHNRDIAHLGLMFLVLALYGYIGDLIGSHLLGAFLSGITFAKVPRTHAVWAKEMDVINAWLLAIFFGATVAFAVPVSELLSLDAFWKGLVLALTAGILGKVIAGIALKKRWVVGWAMVGRGEFAFLVAQTLKETIFQDTEEAFLSEEGFAVSVWALLIATIVAPIAFGIVLASQIKKDKHIDDEKVILADNVLNKQSKLNQKRSVNRMTSVLNNQRQLAPRSEWVVSIGCKYQKNLLIDIMKIFAKNNIHLKSYMNEGEYDLENTLITATISVPDTSEVSNEEHAVHMKPSVNMLTGNNSTLEHTTYKDDYFKFDINKYIERITDAIKLTITCVDKTVLIERIGGNGQRNTNSQTVHESFIPPESKVDDEGDDNDSVGSNPKSLP